MNVVEFTQPETAEYYLRNPLLPAFDPGVIQLHRADAHFLVIDKKQSVAHASLWWRDVPELPGERLGIIGHFAACDEMASKLLLSKLLQVLGGRGCTLAIGPMDGNTWRRYRFVTDVGNEPPFFLEPENPPSYPKYFLSAGFTPLAGYSSALVTDIYQEDSRRASAIEQLEKIEVSYRSLDMTHFEEEMKAIYRLSLKSFSQNFLYTPIDEAEFLAQYTAIAPWVRPELTLLAEHEGEPIGYLFAIPDQNQNQHGEKIDTCIIKTMAVLPEWRGAGLGGVLMSESQRIAHEQGYRRVIHALMHEDNKSQNISSHYAHTMRRYTLFQKRLATAG